MPPEQRAVAAVIGVTTAATQDGRPQIDGAACGFDGTRLVGIAQERVSRRKHDGHVVDALRVVLEHLDVDPSAVAVVASTCGEVSPAPGAPVPVARDPQRDVRSVVGGAAPVRWVPSHHLSHAIGAWHSAPPARRLVLVVDEAGSAEQGDDPPLFERMTAYLMTATGEAAIVASLRTPWELGGLGAMYARITDAVGLDGSVDGGKLMALAAFAPSWPEGATPRLVDAEGRSGWTAWPEPRRRTHLAEVVVDAPTAPFQTPGGFERDHVLLARRGQDELERSMQRLVVGLCARHEVGAVVLSGGVASNCVMAGRLLDLDCVDEVVVAPSPGDTGQVVGNCLWGAAACGLPGPSGPVGPFLGPIYRPERIARAIATWAAGLPVEPARPAAVADRIADGEVVGIWRGRSELGPRALGHRSLLADPRSLAVAARVNATIKRREGYRPFGASVALDATPSLFGRLIASPAMMLARPLAAPWRDQLQGVCHVDGTCRFQTVDRDDIWFWSVVDAFRSSTGAPAVLNTSFNRAGHPMVETPEEALTELHEMELDALVVDDLLVSRHP